MKKALKLLAVTALAAVIGLSMAGCPPPLPDDGEDGSLGDTLTITNAQVYMWDENENKLGSPFTGTVAGLNYIRNSLLTDVINGTPSVTLTNGKLNIRLGMPKTSALDSMESFEEEGFTVSPKGAKFLSFTSFSTSSNDTYIQQGSNDVTVSYYYCDKAVTVIGEVSVTMRNDDSPPIITTIPVYCAMYLKAGWNSVIVTENEPGISIKTGTPTDDHKWVVENR